MKPITAALALLLITTMATNSSSPGQSISQPTSAPSDPKLEIIKLVLHPVATSQPAMEFPLLPPMLERHPGNAGTSWLIAVAAMPPYSDSNGESPLFDKVDEQLSALPDAFSPAVAGDTLNKFAFGFMDRAARCDTADWGVDQREGVNALLPYLNYLRPAADLLALRARLMISRGDYAGARQALQTGFSMSRQLTTEPFLVQDLVASGIAHLMLEGGVENWIRAGGPNLYWSLTAMPSPFIELAPIADTESALLPWTDTRFTQALHRTLPPEQWRSTVLDVMRIARVIGPSSVKQTAQQEDAEYERIKSTIYPEARGQLELKGMSAQRIDALSADQVVGEYMVSTYQKQSDETWKAWALPCPEAMVVFAKNAPELARAKASGNPLLQFIPELFRARLTFAKLEQHIAVLRLIEALRDYAARHGNRFPATLSQATDLPVPLDPIADQPFAYHMAGNGDGTSATIEPASQSSAHALHLQQRYELTIAP